MNKNNQISNMNLLLCLVIFYTNFIEIHNYLQDLVVVDMLSLIFLEESDTF